MNEISTRAIGNGKPKRRSRLLVGILIVLGVIVAGLFIVWNFGHVTGEQFSPNTFYSREFSYKQIPLLGIQVSRTKYYDNSGALQVFLSGKYGPPAGTVTPVWHMVSSIQADGVVRIGPADLLYRYLSDEAADFWLDWSNQHPELADPLWKAVFRAAQRERYDLVPDMMRLARAAKEPEPFEKELHRMLAERWREIGRVRAKAGRFDEAVEAFDESLYFRPDDADTLADKAAAQKQIVPSQPSGEAEKPAAGD